MTILHIWPGADLVTLIFWFRASLRQHIWNIVIHHSSLFLIYWASGDCLQWLQLHTTMRQQLHFLNTLTSLYVFVCAIADRRSIRFSSINIDPLLLEAFNRIALQSKPNYEYVVNCLNGSDSSKKKKKAKSISLCLLAHEKKKKKESVKDHCSLWQRWMRFQSIILMSLMSVIDNLSSRRQDGLIFLQPTSNLPTLFCCL